MHPPAMLRIRSRSESGCTHRIARPSSRPHADARELEQPGSDRTRVRRSNAAPRGRSAAREYASRTQKRRESRASATTREYAAGPDLEMLGGERPEHPRPGLDLTPPCSTRAGADRRPIVARPRAAIEDAQEDVDPPRKGRTRPKTPTPRMGAVAAAAPGRAPGADPGDRDQLHRRARLGELLSRLSLSAQAAATRRAPRVDPGRPAPHSSSRCNPRRSTVISSPCESRSRKPRHHDPLIKW